MYSRYPGAIRAWLSDVYVVCFAAHVEVGFRFGPFSFGQLPSAAPATAGKENNMKKDRNLQFCMDELQSMQNRDGLEPEQRSALEKAEDELKRLWRKPNPTRREIFRAVRKVAEAIISIFVR